MLKKMNNSHCPALRRRCSGKAAPSGEAASWLHWKGKVTVLCLSAYILPAASQDAAWRAWESPSCYYPQAKLTQTSFIEISIEAGILQSGKGQAKLKLMGGG